MTVTRVTAATRVRLPYGTPKLKNLDDSNRSHTSRNVGALPESLQLFVFLFRFDQPRQIGISIFPECKELLISLARFRRIDRKSTRLNSSHSQISYAVFCLKKKKKRTIQ